MSKKQAKSEDSSLRLFSVYFLALLLTVSIFITGFSYAFSSATEYSNQKAFAISHGVRDGKTEAAAEADFETEYFREYSCDSLISCYNNPPEEGLGRVLAGSMGYKFFSKYVPVFMIISFLLILAILFVSQTWIQRVLGLGIPFALNGLMAFLKPLAVNTAAFAVPSGTVGYVQAIINSTLTDVYSFFIFLLVIGLILSLIGAIGIIRKKREKQESTKNKERGEHIKVGKKARKEERKKLKKKPKKKTKKKSKK